jgi:ATP-dependent DNA helicase RecQ
VDRKMPLDDIADSKGLDMEELLDEIETIVFSGTKLNLDYYIEQTLDEDIVDEIYDYFREADNNDIDEALDEFADEEDEYTEEEIKLVRIKFLAENGH